MEEVFNKLQQNGENDVNHLIKWMKDAKVIDGSQDQEAKVRSFFQDAENQNDISLDKFKEVTSKVANEYHVSLDDITKKLTSIGPKLQGAIEDASSSVKQAAKDLLPKF